MNLTLLKQAWKQHPRIVGIIVILLVVALFYGVKTVQSTLHWSDPEHQDQPIQEWMSIRYVARSYDVDLKDLIIAFDLEKYRGEKVNLGEIAKREGIAFEDYKAQLDTYLADHADDHHHDEDDHSEGTHD